MTFKTTSLEPSKLTALAVTLPAIEIFRGVESFSALVAVVAVSAESA
ncbi:MAG: hypothetical protein IJ685_04380 [Selenomonadaceae bacterium]|nr:hypothetical protein [Selenomonadaceae bacterium]